MKIEILGKESFSAVDIYLEKDESIVANTNSMILMSKNIELETNIRNGFIKNIAKIIMGDTSIFTNKYKAKETNGEILLASRLPGDLVVIDLEDEFYVRSEAFIAANSNVSLDATWGGANTFFAREGLLLLKTNGKGEIILGGYGGILKKTIKQDEKYIVDTGHIIGFSKNLKYNVGPVGDLKQMLFSGEPLVAEFEGEGEILLQTRNDDDLINWVLSIINKKRGIK